MLLAISPNPVCGKEKMKRRDMKMYEDDFDKFSAYARRGSLPLPEITLNTVENSPRRAKSLKTSRKKKGLGMSPLVREERITGSSNEDVQCEKVEVPETCKLLAVPGTHQELAHTNSAPQMRSHSVNSRRGRVPRNLELQHENRPRSSSLPNVQEPHLLSPPSSGVEPYRVRCFDITSKGGIINRGDSFKTRSNTSICSAASFGSACSDNDLRRLSMQSHGSAHSATSSNEAPYHKVLLLGKDGVGKTAIAQQLMTSEYTGAQNTSFDDEPEKTVSVLLDNTESIMDIIDVPSDEDYNDYEEVDAYVVMYSLTDTKSFRCAMNLIRTIRDEERNHLAIILVANKIDLVRCRQISEEAGKSVATLYDCKYVEVSVVLNHNVDELLVGILSQIRLNEKRQQKYRRGDKRRGSACINLGFFNRLVKSQTCLSRSCDNLLVL